MNSTPAANPHWTMQHLHEHLQYAADLELWTIPFYMSAMYSITDRTSTPFQLIQTVVNQEMLHLQCVANIANAYGYSPKINAPVYRGKTIPHLDFDLDKPDPVAKYSPYTAEIGPLDLPHINAMCLIEYPEWDSGSQPSLKQNVKEYANIGDFYKALLYGASLFQDQVKGNINQVNYFSAFYRLLPVMNVTENGKQGFNQVELLIQLITDQGEGAQNSSNQLASQFQNTADDLEQTLDHFDKFMQIRQAGALPLTYAISPVSAYTAQDKELLHILREHFTQLRHTLEQLFRGEDPADFVKHMISVGASIQNCWKHGVVPQFS